MYKRILSIALLTLAIATLASAEGVTYCNDIQSIVAVRCLGCHGSASPEYQGFKEQKEAWLAKGLGPRMDSYSHLIFYTAWPDTGALMRRLDDAKPGNMYQHLGDNDAERQKNLSLFKAWVGNWHLKKWPESSKAELDGIKVPY